MANDRELLRLEAAYDTAMRGLANADAWTDFLRSAGRNYKRRFGEQILIHARKPDATAVLDADGWLKRYGRGIKRNARDIPVFAAGGKSVRYFYDVSDTEIVRPGAPEVPIWEMKPEHGSDVARALNLAFGTNAAERGAPTEPANAILAAVRQTSKVAARDLLGGLSDAREGGSLADADGDRLNAVFGTLTESSAAYMLLSRCGIDPGLFVEAEDFAEMFGFDTPKTLHALGNAVNAAARPCLSEIAAVVLAASEPARARIARPSARIPAGQTQMTFAAESDRSTVPAPPETRAKFDMHFPAGEYPQNFYEDSRYFSYDFMTAQGDMTVTELPPVESVLGEEGKADRRAAKGAGLANAAAQGETREGEICVKNEYTHRYIIINGNSITHSINGDAKRILTNTRLGAVIGEISKRAVPVNGLRTEDPGVRGTYAMAGPATDEKGREYVAILTVENREVSAFGLIDVAHALSGRVKRNDRTAQNAAGVPAPVVQGGSVGTGHVGTDISALTSSTALSEISIADFLEIVNGTHQGILSDDVLAHFGAERDPESRWNGRTLDAGGKAAAPAREATEIEDPPAAPVPAEPEEPVAPQRETRKARTEDNIAAQGFMPVRATKEKGGESVRVFFDENGGEIAPPPAAPATFAAESDRNTVPVPAPSETRTETEPATQEREGTKGEFDDVKNKQAEPEEPAKAITPAPERNTPDTPTDEKPRPAGGENFRITDDSLGAGGFAAKFRGNVEAVRTLKAVERENRPAAPAEQAILSRYVGWGALSEVFDPARTDRSRERAELQGLLTPSELESARASTLNAHYTSPAVVKAIWEAVENFGFENGRILEPSCGTGNFFGLLPGSMRESKLYGVELDDVTARIATLLYPGADIRSEPFERSYFSDGFFDLAVGNVPFGGFGVIDDRYDTDFRIHDYFFQKTLDKVRAGGIVAFVTSKGTLDKENPAARRYIAARAELLGAIRLPNTAFKGNAGTEVTADILFLQKRDRLAEEEPYWVNVSETKDGVPVNAYFARRPEHLLGTMRAGVGMYGGEGTACVPFPDADLSELLREAVRSVRGNIAPREAGADGPEQEDDGGVPADERVRNFGYALVTLTDGQDGERRVSKIGEGELWFREGARMFPAELSKTALERVKGMIEIRDRLRTLIDLQTEDRPESEIEAERARLNELYDAFAAKHGRLNDRANASAFQRDGDYPLLCSLENLDDERNFKSKADMFTKRTIRPHVPITRADTSSDALIASLSEKARVDLEYMADLTGKDREILLDDLKGIVFLDVGSAEAQEKAYVTADEYLSGNVREKLKLAESAAKFNPKLAGNVEALKAVQPKDLNAGDIDAELGATWIPADVVRLFAHELLLADAPSYFRDRIDVHFSKLTADWTVTGKSSDPGNVRAVSAFGTKRANAYKIIEDTLNLRDVRIFDIKLDDDGKEKRVLNKKETAVARDKQELIKEKFAEWVWQDPARRERLCGIYNERFNSVRPREYDGSHLEFAGMNPEVRLDPHQKNAVARHLYGGNALFGHVVGAGKTFSMIAAAMEAKRLGLCHKSVFVVPNNIVADFAVEFYRLYPAANVLTVTEKDFEKKNRRKFFARIASGDWDGVIVAHSQFTKIPMSREWREKMLNEQIADVTAGIEEIKHDRDERVAVKGMERTRRSLRLELEKLNSQSGKDDLLTFEQLGADRLFVDEADMFKNLKFVTKMRNVAGLAQADSQKASDLFMKTRWLDKQTDGRGTVFATGTPISNGMAELYTVQRYLGYDALEESGLAHFDCWASVFGKTVTGMEITPEGAGYRSKTRFAEFHNLPELMAMFRQVADIQTKDMLNLRTPKVNFHTVVAKPSETQKETVAGFAERADKVRRGEVSAYTDNMLMITSDGRKLALDQRLSNPLLPDFDGSKVNLCVKNVFDVWKRTEKERLTQIVFCDLSTPKGDGTFNVYDDVKAKLTASGVPEAEIAFVHEAKNANQKKELFAKVRAGKVRVLLGSTQKLGAGTNVQNRLIALHDLDCPWRPRDLEQRLGRIERQGNENPEVEVFRYVTENTFDAYLYQMIENKQRSISQVFTSKSPPRVVREIDDDTLSYAEIKALATGNPLIVEHCALTVEVNRLNTLKSAHANERFDLEDKMLKTWPAEIKRLGERIAGYEADARLAVRSAGGRTVTIRGTTFPPDERKAAGAALLEACKTVTPSAPVSLGRYGEFATELSYDVIDKAYVLTLTGALSHKISLGSDASGNLARVENALAGLDDKKNGCEERLAAVKARLEQAGELASAPFPHEAELAEKRARLAALSASLKLDDRDRELLDDASDERDGDAEPDPAEKRRSEHER